MTTQFRQIILMVENVSASVEFYREGLGLKVNVVTETWAELEADGTEIALHATTRSYQTESSPILSFHVADVYTTVEDLEAMGGRLEGIVRQLSFGKVALVRTPDGHLLNLLQPVDDHQLRELLSYES
ncbi:glyoxalase/bleomycin resistance protein/dioxygenase [Leptolyngbya boryana NIES-2135]|jgi:catechol 2,3-dioxygenase-like lactoylglutathione lyase family enzyme|uniref:Glyoxalase/bleomycin resistance protein/dioxygenase n=1 Tax=Leptolyngbya boryana NIES-2135 TaxID=1973484 RepID=A0A1Z4JPE6_LEPBY|nr:MULTISPECIES: VOC family protein [Leptolyngbya]BAY58655.1 glyoxalase/bleomycin resistance protein/dioxygenase [Leptolyngbya boryana NIES-2135]MBD1856346.1 VOC family protein [Leptolyngbya sp. FACHB-1624]MBD2371043.1 VOC family protein [Leptolyngbya sp. FACHB-161]MBD2377237.1 VOC family protein [Leptolyngbya sp. FACHB-238]MBD2401965.1 VOC family protein [Leptolyngbya sp. FACHB-239]